jgi:hypothetical protein
MSGRLASDPPELPGLIRADVWYQSFSPDLLHHGVRVDELRLEGVDGGMATPM